MDHWTRSEEKQHPHLEYRHVDGWRLHYDRQASPHGWVLSSGEDLLPWREARNHDLGPDDAEKALEWADGVIGFGQEWANGAIHSGEESATRIM